MHVCFLHLTFPCSFLSFLFLDIETPLMKGLLFVFDISYTNANLKCVADANQNREFGLKYTRKLSYSKILFFV